MSEPTGTLTLEDFLSVVEKLMAEPRRPVAFPIYPPFARQIDWRFNRLLLRRLYREAGYPRGRNQGAFKQWALAVGRYP